MPYLNCELPPYPCLSDMWDALATETRPIVVYGMGNGADKLIKRFEKYGIEIADFFASDGFVRGHSFHGKRVKSFSEIKETYSDFVIVLSFASNRDEVIDMLCDIDGKFDMLVPDMPVAGEEEYFDKEFYNNNYQAIVRALERLSDEDSKRAFCATVNYKLTGRMKYLMGAWSTPDEMFSLLPCGAIEYAVDAGAYNGDTARLAKEYFPRLKKVVCIEPDVKNFKKLVKYSEAECDITVETINAAAWDVDACGLFSSSGNRNSSVNSTASFEHRETSVPLMRIDSLKNTPVDYIKYDVEGAEAEALLGSRLIIEEQTPAMLVSLYHRSRDIFSLVNYLYENYPQYKFYLRRLRCLPAWELNLILVK